MVKSRFIMLAFVLIGTAVIFNSCNKNEDEEPPTVVTGEISEVAFQSAYCEGNITDDGGSPIKVKGVCWALEHQPTTSGMKSDHGEGKGSFKSALTGLSPNTTYYIRAYATTDAGTGYGDEKSFKTMN